MDRQATRPARASAAQTWWKSVTVCVAPVPRMTTTTATPTALPTCRAMFSTALPVVALSALPVHKEPNGHYATLLGTSEAHGGFAGDPVLGIVKHLHLGALQSAGEIYVGLLASTILFIAAVVCGLLVIPVGKMMRGVPAGDR